jgi:hypothetical protein
LAPLVTVDKSVGIIESANVGYRRCISTHNITIPGTSAAKKKMINVEIYICKKRQYNATS